MNAKQWYQRHYHHIFTPISVICCSEGKGFFVLSFYFLVLMASALDSGSGMDIVESGEATTKIERGFRAEIDTSAPFESVKEAVSRFGGIGYWKPYNLNKFSDLEHDKEEVDIVKVEEHAVQLEKDLIMKERETLDVLKELESTKMIVEELKLKLQKEASDVSLALQTKSDCKNMTCAVMDSEKENCGNINQNPVGGLISFPSSAPGLILMELKQAKLNLTRTTTDLAGIRTSVDSLNKKLEKERSSLERTRERLTLNSSKISSLEEELSQTRLKLQQVEIKDGTDDSPSDISREIQRLSSEAEEFKKTSEAARSEVLRALSEIEQTKTRIKTAEIRLFAARKMKQAARAAEAAAFAEIKCLSKRENSDGDSLQSSGVTLSIEEYSMLTSKAQEAEELSKKRVLEAMLQVDEANTSKMEILKRVEEATKEVKTSKKTLEDALSRVEAANRGKLAVEEALRKWRSEHGQKRRSVHNSTKFKNPSHQRRESRLIDVNGLNLVSDDDEPSPVLKPTLSIGQILSRKLLLPQELEMNKHEGMSSLKQKVSLGQMLNKQPGDVPAAAAKAEAEKESGQKQFLGKRKKFGFARFSLLLAKQSKKKKKPTLNLR